MIDRSHALAFGTQARLLGIARSTVYREHRPVPAADPAVMRQMGIETLYRRPRTQQTGTGAQDLSVSAARRCGDAAQPGLGHGHHVHSDGAGVRLPCGGAGLV